MSVKDPRGAHTESRLPFWGKLLAGGLFGVCFALLIRAGPGSWLRPVLLGVLVVGLIAVFAGDSVRRSADLLLMLVQDPTWYAQHVRIQHAERVGVAGDTATSVEILDAVAATRARRRVPLLGAQYNLVRGAVAEAQGDLPRAEAEFRAAIAVYERRWDRSAHSEALQKLGKVQLIRGDNAAGYRTVTRALQVGGGRMYRLSRVRTELYLVEIAANNDDLVQAVAHATTARELAIRWHCHVEHGIACDILSFTAVDDDRLDAASAWLVEAEQAFERGAAPLPARLRHTMAKAVVANARGDHREALNHYLTMMGGVAELRAGWGWRDAQAYFVDLYSAHEVSAFQIAYLLQQQGDEAAVDDFAALLDLGSRTAMRRMLRGELQTEQPADLDGAELGDITEVLGQIATRETAIETSVGPDDAGAAYERLEALVSMRFRHTMEPATEASTHDVRSWAVGWKSHVLQLRMLADGEAVHVAGLWTTPDGDRHPFLHPVSTAQARLLGEVTGIPDVLIEPGEAPSLEPVPPDASAPEGVRAEAPGWKVSPRFRHLITAKTSNWAELAAILLPAGLVELLRRTDPAAAVPKLLLVPDSFLWRMPWAALRIAPEHPEGYLMDRAVLATLPSLSLLEESAEPAAERGAGGAIAYLAGVNSGGLDIERRALTRAYGTDFRSAASAAEFIAALAPSGPRPSIAMASVHGNSRPGLAHALKLGQGVDLSAARMLTLRFPPVLMINACLSAELDDRHGTDPLGIPTVALCRGARTVIAGIFPLPDGQAKDKPAWSDPTPGILAILYQLLADGVPASSALRTAQRQWRRERGWTPPYLWAGLVSITVQLDDPDWP